MKPTLCLDFDGVIHSYESGWQGPRVIPDPPVPGALEFITKSLDDFQVAIFSSRSGYWFGRRAMKRWLYEQFVDLGLPDVMNNTPVWWLDQIKSRGDWFAEPYDHTVRAVARNIVYGEIQWPTRKPPAKVTLDDRAVRFNGTFPPRHELQTFQPWFKR